MGYNRNLDRQNAAFQTWRQRNWPTLIGGLIVILFAAVYVFVHIPEVKAEDTLLSTGTIIESIYWSDGDSGRANHIKFRLSDADAPETGGVGAAIGGAKCEKEREWGFRAKEFMVLETNKGELVVTENYGKDRHGRWVISISDDEKDIVELGMKNGVIRSWRHDGKKALEPRPNWCEP